MLFRTQDCVSRGKAQPVLSAGFRNGDVWIDETVAVAAPMRPNSAQFVSRSATFWTPAIRRCRRTKALFSGTFNYRHPSLLFADRLYISTRQQEDMVEVMLWDKLRARDGRQALRAPDRLPRTQRRGRVSMAERVVTIPYNHPSSVRAFEVPLLDHEVGRPLTMVISESPAGGVDSSPPPFFIRSGRTARERDPSSGSDAASCLRNLPSSRWPTNASNACLYRYESVLANESDRVRAPSTRLRAEALFVLRREDRLERRRLMAG
jgi:hypothetical protein